MAKQPENQTLRIERFDRRIVYSKTGRARYISHLDLMRTMQRVFKRAGVPLWYTQGFNPHTYLMFPLALSLGTDSDIEILDVALTEDWDFDKLMEKVNPKMPEGLKINSVSLPVMKHIEIEGARYTISITTNFSAQKTVELFSEMLSFEKIEVEKKTKKKGMKLVDIKEHIQLNSASVQQDKAIFDVTLPAGVGFNLNTTVLMEAFCKLMNVEIDSIYTKRTKIMAKNGEDFA